MTAKRTDKPLDIYLRISMDKENDAEGVQRQERLLRKEAKRRGRTIGKVIIDNDVSATTGKPMPGRDELYARMQSGESGGVLVYHIKRLLRRSIDMEALILTVEATGAEVLSIQSADLDLNTASGRAIARVFAAFGQMEVEEIQERMRSYFQDRAARGVPLCRGRRPFGWNDDWRTLHKGKCQADCYDENDHLKKGPHKHHNESKLYKELFDQVIAGRSLSWIARDWESRGILDVKGKIYSVSTLRARIKSPRAVGLSTYKGVPQGQGDWEPIVTQKVQDAALAALKSRRQRQLRMTGEKRSPRLLSSLIVCGVEGCDRVMRLVRSGNAVNYKCDLAGHGQVICELAEEEVEKRFLLRLRDPKTHAALEKLRRRQPNTSKLVAEIEQIQATIDGAAADMGAGLINRKTWLTIHEGSTTRLEEAKRKLHAAGDNPALLAISPDVVAKKWDDFDLDQKRLYLAPWISAVRIAPLNGTGGRNFRPERVVVEWRV